MRIDKCRCVDPSGPAAMAGFRPAQHVVPSSLPVNFQLDFKLLHYAIAKGSFKFN